ncbi:MAG: hypothetical protein AAGH76_03300 [Pseudomonadota bacterium]
MSSITRRTFAHGMATGAIALTAPGLSLANSPSVDPGFILGKGPAGWCDEAKNGGAVVRWNAAASEWWMWYYGRDNNFPADVAPAFGTGRIAVATSPDGVTWTRFKGPLTGGAVMDWNDDAEAFDSTHIASGDILRHNDEWLLWYFGGDSTIPTELGGHAVPESYQKKGYRCRPGVARSRDGVRWNRIKGAATGGAAVDIGDNVYGAFPSGIHDGERFLLYYTTLSPDIFYWETKVAESTDLVNWNVLGNLQWAQEPAIWELGGSNTRHILPNPDKKGRRWLMVYTALDSRLPRFPRLIAAATSDDGLMWHRLHDEPILHMGPLSGFDSGGVSYPQLVPHDDGSLYLYYYGFANPMNKIEPTRGIGLAVSENGDLTKFRRIRHTPN